MNKEEFLIKLKQNITSIFNEIDEKDDLFGFGIFTSQDVNSILIYYNTYTYFSDQLKKCFLEDNRIVSYNKWAMPEWYGCIDDDNNLVDEINDILYNVIQPQELEVNPDNFNNNILDLLCKALVELKEEGLFKDMKENFILHLKVADSWVSDLVKLRISKLNNLKNYVDFVHTDQCWEAYLKLLKQYNYFNE